MSRAAFSLRVFSVYLVCLGAALVIFPNPFLAIFQISPTHDVWLRVAGMLLLIIAYYYFRAAGAEMREFFRWTAHGRLSVIVFFVVFVLCGLAPPILILFGAIDAAAAFWTLASLRNEKNTTP